MSRGRSKDEGARDGKKGRARAVTWSEDEVIDGKEVRAFVMIVPSRGCSWFHRKGCTMCGYSRESDREIGTEEMLAAFDEAAERFEGEEWIKVYTSGSFLDGEELPREVRDRILDWAEKHASRITFETRPEYVNEKVLKEVEARKIDVEIAIGLESASDEVLSGRIVKGFTFDDYRKASTLIRNAGFEVRTYLLLKPPFTSERAALKDTVQSAKAVAGLTDTISINPVNVQKGTKVERLWNEGQYRPPWTWTLVEALTQIGQATGARVISAPSGLGRRRGVHNCGKCDGRIGAAITEFNRSQEPGVFGSLNCSCKDQWEIEIGLEELTFNSGLPFRTMEPSF